MSNNNIRLYTRWTIKNDYKKGRDYLKTSDFNFDLPQELIAQTPIEDRSASRLMVLDFEDKRF